MAEEEGTDFELGRTMQPSGRVKHQLQILSGLDHVNATPGPGRGRRSRAGSWHFLTGVRVKKTAGADIHAGVSIDQIAANHIGHLTRFPSLELTCDAVRQAGNCDSGYSCAYQYNLAWRSPNTPVRARAQSAPPFERLFGAGSPDERKENSCAARIGNAPFWILCSMDARTLQRQLRLRDKQKLDGVSGERPRN